MTNVQPTLSRCRIVVHDGQRIAWLDLRDLDGASLLHALGEYGRFRDAEAADVRLVLTDVTGTPLTEEAVEFARRLVDGDVRATRSAIVGIVPLNMACAERIKSGNYFARDVEDALAWLAWEGKRILA